MIDNVCRNWSLITLPLRKINQLQVNTGSLRSVNLNSEMGWLLESEALSEAVAESIEKNIVAANRWHTGNSPG